MPESAWNVFIDGASRGNPGRAAYAVVIERPGAAVYEEADLIGEATNNVAEYTALIRALQRARQWKARRLVIHSDSELLVKQMNGEYRVKSEQIQPLYDEANLLCSEFDEVVIRHVRRSENARADRLCNEALDGRPRPPIAGGAVYTVIAPSLRDEAIAVLRRAAADWSRGDPERPSPESVWEQLQALWQRHTERDSKER